MQFGNFWELVHMYLHSAPIFNMDPTAMVKMQSSTTIYSVESEEGIIISGLQSLLEQIQDYYQKWDN